MRDQAGIARGILPEFELVAVIVAVSVQGLEAHLSALPEDSMGRVGALQRDHKLDVIGSGARRRLWIYHVVRVVRRCPSPLGKFDVNLIRPVGAHIRGRILEQS